MGKFVSEIVHRDVRWLELSWRWFEVMMYIVMVTLYSFYLFFFRRSHSRCSFFSFRSKKNHFVLEPKKSKMNGPRASRPFLPRSWKSTFKSLSSLSHKIHRCLFFSPEKKTTSRIKENKADDRGESLKSIAFHSNHNTKTFTEGKLAKSRVQQSGPVILEK